MPGISGNINYNYQLERPVGIKTLFLDPSGKAKVRSKSEALVQRFGGKGRRTIEIRLQTFY